MSSRSTAQSSASVALIRRIGREYLWRHWKKLTIAIVCMIVVAVMTAANAWLMEPVIDGIFLEESMDMLMLVPLAILGVTLFKAVAMYGQTVILNFIGQRIISDMQIRLFNHLMKSDIGLFQEQSTGKLISRFTNDIMMMRNAVSNIITGLVRELLSMVFLVGMMIYQSWQLSIIALLVLPTAIWPMMRLSKRMRKISRSTQEKLGDFTTQLDEIFSGVRMVKAYNREEYESTRAKSIIEHLFTLYYKAVRVQAASSPLMEMLGGFAIAGIIFYGGYQVVHGDTTPGSFTSFIVAMLMAYRPLKAISNLNTSLQNGLAAAERYYIAVDSEPLIMDKPGTTPLKVTSAEIRFEDVCFRYSEKGAGVEDINIHIPGGQTVALVGSSGSGKSTLINLLLRFFDIQSGAIRIDGQDLRDVTIHSIREQMAMVSQEIVLFDETVRSNIAYGRDGASEEDIIEAAKNAAAHEFIMELPQGYDTPIGANGVKLSGGQRQRLAIARAMLKNAPILLLDEATSALDTTSERQVQEALTRLMHNRTTLVIAHRLSTIQQAQCIYVVERGKIVESGSHHTLLEKNGAYARLYHAQFEQGNGGT